MEYIKSAMNIAGFPDEARRPILEAAKLTVADSRCAVLTKKLLNREFNDTQTEIVNPLKAAAAEYGVHEYTMVMAFYLLATELLLEKYRDAGIDEQNFRDMLTDYRCKLMECHDNYGIWGTASMAWHAPFFTLARMQLGRFQYDNAVFPYEIYTKRGYTIKKNDPCVRFHIPSSGPLVASDRYDSYRRAYGFFRERFNGVVPIACISWLLYPGHEEFLAPNSNLISFMHDFDFLVGAESAPGQFGNKWRVFGRQHDETPPDRLPQDTSMQRAYSKRLAENGRSGTGYGLFFHTENGIVR